MGKLFNRLLQKRLDNFLENNNLLSPNQTGFRKGFRTTDNIFILKTVINKYLNRRNGKVFVCFVDFKKVFDSVWRQALLFKLLDKGIGRNFYKIIKHIYSNTKYSYKSGLSKLLFSKKLSSLFCKSLLNNFPMQLQTLIPL
jgi:hypothetical protein